MCTDLLSIGDGAVIRKDSFFNGYRAHDGVIQTGAVSIGKDALVGEVTVLDIWTSLGEGPSSGTPPRCTPDRPCPTVSAGTARPRSATDVDYQRIPTMDVSALRRVVFATVQLVNLLLLGAPLAFVGRGPRAHEGPAARRAAGPGTGRLRELDVLPRRRWSSPPCSSSAPCSSASCSWEPFRAC